MPFEALLLLLFRILYSTQYVLFYHVDSAKWKYRACADAWRFIASLVEKFYKDCSAYRTFSAENQFSFKSIIHLKQKLSSCWRGRPFGHNGHGPKSKNGTAALCLFLWGKGLVLI